MYVSPIHSICYDISHWIGYTMYSMIAHLTWHYVCINIASPYRGICWVITPSVTRVNVVVQQTIHHQLSLYSWLRTVCRKYFYRKVNSLQPIDAIRWHRPWSRFARKHHLNHCSFINNKVLWHSTKTNFTWNTCDIYWQFARWVKKIDM